MVKHEKIHTGEKPFLYDLCKKAFNSNIELMKHKMIITVAKQKYPEIQPDPFMLTKSIMFSQATSRR